MRSFKLPGQMYKVFFNEKKIIFTRQSKITLNKPSTFFDKNGDREQLSKWFFSIAESDENEFVATASDPKKLLKNFKSVFKEIKAAGGVVLQQNKLLFIFRNNRWDLPKGKIEKGEKKKEAAIREVSEECGISGLIITKKLETSYHIFCSEFPETKGQWILKKTFWYEMSYRGNETTIPQIEEGITKVQWVDRNNLDAVLESTYSNLAELISLYRD